MNILRGIAHTIYIAFGISRKDYLQLKVKPEKERELVKGIIPHERLIDPKDESTIRYRKIIIELEIDLYELTGLDFFTEEQLSEIQNKLADYMLKNFDIDFYDHRIRTLDFSFDFEFSGQEKELFLQMYKRNTMKYMNRYRKIVEQETVYFNSCKSETNKGQMAESKVMRVYDKFKQCGDVKYINALRFEVSIRGRHLEYQKHANKVNNTIENYIIEAISYRYFYTEFAKIIFSADFHTYNKAYDEIHNSTFSQYRKIKLKRFIGLIYTKSLYTVYQELKEKDKTKDRDRANTFWKYIHWLEEINVNALLLPDQSEIQTMVNPVKLIREKASI